MRRRGLMNDKLLIGEEVGRLLSAVKKAILAANHVESVCRRVTVVASGRRVRARPPDVVKDGLVLEVMLLAMKVVLQVRRSPSVGATVLRVVEQRPVGD